MLFTGDKSKKDLTKIVDVDKVINRSGPFTAHSNQTKNSDQNPDFVKSLKAQGYEESQSQSKLVYDFKKKTDSPTTHQRHSSPYKPNPLQFIRPAQNQYSPKSAKKIVPAKSNHTNNTSPKKSMEVFQCYVSHFILSLSCNHFC